jgi:hypothetical protein
MTSAVRWWSRNAVPSILEAMIFGSPLDGDQDPHSTEYDAREGHAVILQRTRPH